MGGDGPCRIPGNAGNRIGHVIQGLFNSRFNALNQIRISHMVLKAGAGWRFPALKGYLQIRNPAYTLEYKGGRFSGITVLCRHLRTCPVSGRIAPVHRLGKTQLLVRRISDSVKGKILRICV